MKTKKIFILVVTTLLVFAAFSVGCCHADTVSLQKEDVNHRTSEQILKRGDFNGIPDVETAVNKKWTWLFYDDADFTPGFDPFDWFAEEAYSGENLDVIVLQDTYGGPAKLWHIDENHNTDLLQDMGEVDMGDYQTLYDFVEYSKENYPADRYLLSFYDHGGGWTGACVDDTDGGWLTMDEIQKALTETGGVDIVCFTAPCLMGALESVYELRDCVDVYVGSEELSGYAWWGYIISDICDILNQHPDTDNIALGEQIINIIEEDHYRWDYAEAITMSAIRTDKIEELVNSLDIVASDFIDNFTESYEKVWSIYNDIQYFGYGRYLDVYDFAEKCLSVETDQTICQDLENVMECMSEVVIAECHGTEHPDAHGLTIYFPDPSKGYSYDSTYADPDYELDFSQNTYWDEFLNLYLGLTPIIVVYAISGGMGVTVALKNIGVKDAIDSPWEITIDAPIMFSGGESSGTVDLSAGKTAWIKSDFVFGIGPATITVTTDISQESVHGFVGGPWVLIG